MPDLNPETLASVIVKDFLAAADAPWEKACTLAHRAVRTLRTAAGSGQTSILAEERKQIDDAIQVVQPIIVGNPPVPDLRILVGALHVVNAEWANPNRQPIVNVPANVLEAFLLARILDNWLDDANLMNLLRRHRAAMDDKQLQSLGGLVNELYPWPVVVPTHSAEGTVH